MRTSSIVCKAYNNIIYTITGVQNKTNLTIDWQINKPPDRHTNEINLANRYIHLLHARTYRLTNVGYTA